MRFAYGVRWRNVVLMCGGSVVLQLLPSVAASQWVDSKLDALEPANFKVPVMVSVTRSGQIVSQEEVLFTDGGRSIRLQVPAGTYDVRVEGEGLVTEVKRGIQVPEKGIYPQFLLRKGQARVIEYASGGISREEVATRLTALEVATQTPAVSLVRRGNATGRMGGSMLRNHRN